MAVMVTGGGMVGGQVLALLADRGETPVLFDVAPPMAYLQTIVDVSKVKIVRGDILSMPDILHAIKNEGIDRIIHTAGFLLSAVRERPYDGVTVNIQGTMNMLEASRLTGVKRIVFTSTGVVSFGAVEPGWPEPLAEDFDMKCLTHRPKAVYPVTKLACEYLGLCYYDLYKVDFVTVRLSSVFGPCPGQASSIPGRTIDQFVRPAMRGERIVVQDPLLSYAGGSDFVYSKDTARGCVCACFADPASIKQRVYTIHSGQFVTFQYLVDTVKRLFPSAEMELKFVAKTGSAGFPYPSTESKDLSRARNEIGYVPEYNLEKALRDYTGWLKAYPERLGI
jgi:nucleoside-diphosphate-sugar epimerase